MFSGLGVYAVRLQDFRVSGWRVLGFGVLFASGCSLARDDMSFSQPKLSPKRGRFETAFSGEELRFRTKFKI